MTKFILSLLPSAAMPSGLVQDAVAPVFSALPSAVRPKAAVSALSVCGAGEGARKPIAPTGASAPHACAEQQKNAVAGANSTAYLADSGWLGNGSTFGSQVQTQAAVNYTRVDGREGSPPRGTPA